MKVQVEIIEISGTNSNIYKFSNLLLLLNLNFVSEL